LKALLLPGHTIVNRNPAPGEPSDWSCGTDDLSTRSPWLRLNVIRDVGSGLVVLTMMLTEGSRSVGVVLLVLAIIPFGDMSNILGSGGSKSTAFSVHGITCAVMLVVGLLLIHTV
jgi:hypothetical protein